MSKRSKSVQNNNYSVDYVRNNYKVNSTIPTHWNVIMHLEAIKMNKEFNLSNGEFSKYNKLEVQLYELCESEGIIGPPAMKIVDAVINHLKLIK